MALITQRELFLRNMPKIDGVICVARPMTVHFVGAVLKIARLCAVSAQLFRNSTRNPQKRQPLELILSKDVVFVVVIGVLALSR